MVVMGVYVAFSGRSAGVRLRDVARFNNINTANVLFLTKGAVTTRYLLTGSITKFCTYLGLTAIGIVILTVLIFAVVVAILFLQ